MSFESRLKSSLERDANVVEPDVGAALGTVRRSHQTRRRVRMAAYSFTVVAVVTAGVIGGPRALDAIRGDDVGFAPGRHPAIVRGAYADISGVYASRIGERPGVIRTYKLAGRWTMRLSADGKVALTSPQGFIDALGPVTEAGFALDGGRLRTQVMYHEGIGCTGEATYAWTLEGNRLHLTPVDDACPYRPTVLGGVWIRHPE